MTTDLATVEHLPDDIEMALMGGDLSKLDPARRLSLYRATCDSLGLNPLTNPFQYITVQGRLVLYATRNCTDQLRKLERINLAITGRELVAGAYVVTARASMGDRSDESIGAVPVEGLKGEALANAMMKCETKAKRRVTLSIRGLSFIDESEADSIAGARVVPVDEAHALTAPTKQAADAQEYTQLFGQDGNTGSNGDILDWMSALRAAHTRAELDRVGMQIKERITDPKQLAQLRKVGLECAAKFQ